MKLKTLSPGEIEKELDKAKVGGFFRKDRLFDERFAALDFDDLNLRVRMVMLDLASEGFSPSEDYEADDADCDNWSLWIHSEVTKGWAKEKRNAGAIAFGRALVPGHDINIGVSNQGVHVWNYGMHAPDFDLSEIKEVEFK